PALGTKATSCGPAATSEDRLLLAREEPAVPVAVPAAQPGDARRTPDLACVELRSPVAEHARMRIEGRVAGADDAGLPARAHRQRAPVKVAAFRLVPRMRVLGRVAGVAADV